MFNAGTYYDEQLTAKGFPHINMTPWFQDLRADKVMASIQEKAREKQVSIDQMFRKDAVWCFNNLNDWSRFVDENSVEKAFQLFRIEHNLRRDPAAIKKVKEKCRVHNLPFRVVMNRETHRVYNNKF